MIRQGIIDFVETTDERRSVLGFSGPRPILAHLESGIRIVVEGYNSREDVYMHTVWIGDARFSANLVINENETHSVVTIYSTSFRGGPGLKARCTDHMIAVIELGFARLLDRDSLQFIWHPAFGEGP